MLLTFTPFWIKNWIIFSSEISIALRRGVMPNFSVYYKLHELKIIRISIYNLIKLQTYIFTAYFFFNLLFNLHLYCILFLNLLFNRFKSILMHIWNIRRSQDQLKLFLSYFIKLQHLSLYFFHIWNQVLTNHIRNFISISSYFLFIIFLVHIFVLKVFKYLYYHYFFLLL